MMTVVPDMDFEMTKFTNSVIMNPIMGSSQWVNDLFDDIFFKNVYCLLKFYLNNGTFLLMFTLWYDMWYYRVSNVKKTVCFVLMLMNQLFRALVMCLCDGINHLSTNK